MFKKGGLGLLFVFILLLVGIMFFVIFLFNYNSKPEPVVVNVTVNKTFYNLSIKSDNGLVMSYVLENSSRVLVNGTLFPGLKEEYNGGVEANTSVNLTVFGDGYYMRKVSCNVTVNDFVCFINSSKKASDFVVNLSNGSLVLSNVDGLIQSPIFCFVQSPRIYNVRSDLSYFVKPKDLETKVDFCYGFHDVKNDTVVPIRVIFNDLIPTPDVLSVVVRDFEVKGYSNIGDKWGSVVI